ncbi:MAG: lysylphosphatidylglycerol synthase domain-containing protein [Gemmatimonas sp.]
MSHDRRADRASGAVAPNSRRIVWRALQAVFLVIALAFTARQVATNWDSVRASAATVDPNWMLIVLASVIVFATYAALIQSWRMLLAGEGSVLRFGTAARIWFIANLGRYIPGKVWSIAALNVMAAREGVAGTAAAGAAILGTLINIGAGFGVIALSSSRLTDSLNPGFRTASVVGSLIFALGVLGLPWILPPVATWLAARLGRTVPPVKLPAFNLFGSVSINILSWFCYGLAFMVFARGIMPGVHGSIAEFTGVWTASYTFGYLAFFAPGGLIFREAAMIAAMAGLGMCSTTDAALIAATSRLWLSVVEVLPGLLALTVSPLKSRNGP